MSETALTTTNNTIAPVTASNDVLASMVRLRPTMVELVPLTSQKPGAIPGKFRDAVTLEHYDSITVIPLNFYEGRQKFPKFAPGSTNKPECKSNDGVVPSPFIENPPARTCNACEFSKWGKRDPISGKSARPACDQIYKMLVIIKESQLPRYIQFKGTAIPSFKKFLEALETDRVQVKGREGRKPEIFEYYFTIESFKKISPGSITYIPIFTNIKRVSDPSKFGHFYEQYVLNARNYGNEEEEDQVDVAVDNIASAPRTSEPPIQDAEFVDV